MGKEIRLSHERRFFCNLIDHESHYTFQSLPMKRLSVTYGIVSSYQQLLTMLKAMVSERISCEAPDILCDSSHQGWRRAYSPCVLSDEKLGDGLGTRLALVYKSENAAELITRCSHTERIHEYAISCMV